MELNKFSSEHNTNSLLTLTYENSSSEDFFETKRQANFDKTYQILEQSEEELMDFIEQLETDWRRTG